MINFNCFVCSTLKGTLKLKRLPFGVKMAADIFKNTMENGSFNVPHIVVYQNDITIGGKDLEQQAKSLKTVFKMLPTSGLKVNKKIFGKLLFQIYTKFYSENVC